MNLSGSKMFYSVFLALCTVCCVFVLQVKSYEVPPEDIERDKIIYQKYVEVDKTLKQYVSYGLKMALPYIMEGNEHVNLSSGCVKDLFQLLTSFRRLELPAFKFFDSVGKLSSGFALGNIHMLGDYDECMQTQFKRKDGNTAFKGKYCMINSRPPLPTKPPSVTFHTVFHGLMDALENSSELMKYLGSNLHYYYHRKAKIGVCIPSGCSSEDLDSMLKYIGEKVPIINATVQYCDEYYYKPISNGKIIAIFIFSFIGLLVIIGSFTDYYLKMKDVSLKIQGKNPVARLLTCFSVLSNFPKVVSIQTAEKSLSCLFGVRALSLFWIILLHRYFFEERFNIQDHLKTAEDVTTKFYFSIIPNGYITTEVFFFVGALVNCYTRLQYFEDSKHKENKILLIIHRLMRLYPAYLICILSVYLLLDAHGPVRTLVQEDYLTNCDNNWWRNLLFINNFFDQEEACLFHGWYIAADMQLFLISLFTVPLFLKNPKKAVFLHSGIVMIGLLLTALWAWHKNVLPSLIVNHLEMEEQDRVWNAYCTPLPHIAPYFAGLLSGYYLSTHKDLKISSVNRITGWFVATVAFLSMLFMVTRWNTGEEPTVLESTLYFTFSRIIYVLAVGWMILCCATGYGGIINYILSLKVWVPIARVSYMMFLMSPLIQLSHISNLKTTVDFTPMLTVWTYFGDLCVSFLMALPMTTIIESPFIAIEKIIFKRKPTDRTENNIGNAQDKNDNITNEKSLNAMELQNNIKNTILDMQSKQ